MGSDANYRPAATGLLQIFFPRDPLPTCQPADFLLSLRSVQGGGRVAQHEHQKRMRGCGFCLSRRSRAFPQ